MKWQRMVNEWQQIKMSDSKCQRVVQWMKTNESK